MTVKDWIAAGGIVIALIAAGVSYGRMSEALLDAEEEIRLLRADVAAINNHLVIWVSQHTERP